MIISRAPVRISIAGGGTDLPFFYPKFGGDMIISTIDKYIYVTVCERKFRKEFRIAYSKTENVKTIDEIENNRVREALKLLNIKEPMEISSISEVPGKSGLGSSSAFLIALLKALHTYKKEHISNKILAEEACKIEIDILGEPIGKQDQYASAHGGVNNLNIGKTGQANISSIDISDTVIRGLEENLYMFYTGIQRSASEIIQDQTKKALNDEEKMNLMKEIKIIGQEIKKCLEEGNLRRFGEWLNIHWETKKKMSEKMSTPQIDSWYKIALKNGALGGKIMGAGGGGFFLFYCEKNGQQFIKAMKEEGLEYVPFKFDFDGPKILFDGK
jgi:D-glycero-alpha-D-manno-heptose-7-phosphate kinase